MPWTLGLKCKECGKAYEEIPQAICHECLGPLEVVYDLERIKQTVPRSTIEKGPPSMHRYAPLLPVRFVDEIGSITGYTPLVPAPRLGKELGHQPIFIKNDAVNAPSLSFKDRVVATALAWARQHRITVVGCASTGNLANAVAAQAARHGFHAVIFIPKDLESAKILGTAIYHPHVFLVDGTYDQVNRLCYEVADAYGWGIVNVNLRAYYGDGSRSLGFEIAEQLGWYLPDHVVVPMAGGSLITKIHSAFRDLITLGWVEERRFHLHGAQADGCGPIVHAFQRGDDHITPEKPNTIARSLAIGNPADGRYALQTIRKTHGQGVPVTDEEIRWGIKTLARTEGILAETAGGVVVAAAARLIQNGFIQPGETLVLAITGNGLKTLDAVADVAKQTRGPIRPNLNSFRSAWESLDLDFGA